MCHVFLDFREAKQPFVTSTVRYPKWTQMPSNNKKSYTIRYAAFIKWYILIISLQVALKNMEWLVKFV